MFPTNIAGSREVLRNRMFLLPDTFCGLQEKYDSVAWASGGGADKLPILANI